MKVKRFGMLGQIKCTLTVVLLGFGLFFVILVPSSQSHATEFYVAMNGSDSNSGSQTSPWRTIAKANSVLKPGDTVFIRNGLYDEQISPVCSGLLGKYIMYKAYPGEAPIIDRSRLLTNWRHLRGDIYWTSFSPQAVGVWEDTFQQSRYFCAYWPQKTMSGVDAPGKYFMDRASLRVYIWPANGDPNNHTMRTSVGKGASFSAKSYIAIDGIAMEWVHRGLKLRDCDHCIFQKLTIRYAAAAGMFLGGESHYNKILKNTIYHAGSWFWDEGDGIYLSGHHNLIEGNDISITGHNPIITRGDISASFRNIIQYNKVHDSGSSGLCANVNTQQEVWRYNVSCRNTGAGIQNDSSNNTIYRNILYQNAHGICLYATNGRITQGNRIFHNTCYENYCEVSDRPFEILIADYGTGICNDNVFKNNIIYNAKQKCTIQVDSVKQRVNVITCNSFYPYLSGRLGFSPFKKWASSCLGKCTRQSFLTIWNVTRCLTTPENIIFQSSLIRNVLMQAVFLTRTATTGKGKIVAVEDAGYFCDGFGMVDGDMVQFQGSSEPLMVVNVDYEKNTLELSGFYSWGKGVGISMAFSGVAPDIGAIEFCLAD